MVVTFFPPGINGDNLGWLSPTISDVKGIFDKFCVLSLTYQAHNFIAMPSRLQDYLRPQHPRTSPLLCAIMDHCFSQLRLMGDLEPDNLWFRESQWITSEDANIEHLLYWHKPRSTVLRQRTEDLSGDHHSKPQASVLILALRLFDHSEIMGNKNYFLPTCWS